VPNASWPSEQPCGNRTTERLPNLWDGPTRVCDGSLRSQNGSANEAGHQGMAGDLLRLDWLLRAPGLIRSAAVYSAFLIDDKLYFLRTGPGWQRLGGSYQAFNFVADSVIERQITRNRQAHVAMADWDLRTEVPKLADMHYPLNALTKLQVIASHGTGVATVRLQARAGKPRSLTLAAQDYLAGPQARERFFAAIAVTEYR